jgi:putative membrane protein
MHVAKFFTQTDLDAIAAAVKAAEKRSSGEIVPYVVSHSDHYEAAAWKGAIAGAFLLTLAAAVWRQFGTLWGGATPMWIVVPPIVGAALGYLAVAVLAPLKRAFATRAVLEHHVRQRAAAAFVEREVFKTKARTGILIFLSLFERRVVVLADSGINAKVGQHEWDGIVAEIARGIRAGHPGQALADAIARCGELLARHGMAPAADDTDELPDTLQLREE